MPLFEYLCNECGRKFEELVGTADTVIACPACQSTNTSKLLSVFASGGGGNAAPMTGCSRPGCGAGFS